MATNLKRTDEVVTETQMRDLYDIDEQEEVDDRVETHDGAWIRENTVWRWWEANAE